MWNICRTCAIRQIEMISIFDQDKSPSIAAMITAISTLEILPGDKLPSEICITCFETLEMTYYFKQQVTKCNDALQKQVQRTTLLARCKMLAQQEVNNEVAVKKEEEEFAPNEHTIADSDDVATENVADHASERHTPLMIDNDTYDTYTSKCDVILNFAMPLTSVACDDLPEEIYIKDVNSPSEGAESKPEVNEIDLEEHGVQFGDDCENTSREMMPNNAADVGGFCSEDELPLTSMRERLRSRNVSQGVPDDSNENTELTGESSEGVLKDVGDLCTAKSYKCTYCNKLFNRENTLRYHMYMHTNPRKCKICQKVFSAPCYLKFHMKSHTGERPFHCQECNWKFYSKALLTRHMRRHTGEARPKPHRCEVCGNCFDAPYLLRRHMRSHTGERPFHCPECNSKFYSKNELKQHMRRHVGEKTLHCQECNWTFNSKGDWKEHMRRHPGEVKPKPHRCDVCGNSFDAAYLLRRHMRRHTGEKPFHCQECISKFYTKSELKQHMKRHTDEKPFHCDHCSWKFHAKSDLKKHMRRHTGEDKQLMKTSTD